MPADFDEYLRRQVERLADQVDTGGVLEVVQRRARRRRARRRAQLAALTLAVLVGTGIGTWGLSRMFPTQQQPIAGPTGTTLLQREQTVAVVVLGGDLRVVLTATRAAADRATVQVAAERLADGAWQHLDQRIIGKRDGWSWTALSTPTSICQLAAANANPPRLDISLLVRPSGECSRVYPFSLQDDRLVAG